MTQRAKKNRTTVLLLANHYLPGYKAGGPTRTLANLMEQLGGEYTFKVVTKDRDFKDRTAYVGVAIDAWDRVGKAEILYLSPASQSLAGLRRTLCDTDYDVLYLNSFFAPNFTVKPLLLRRLGLIPHRPVIVAPRGEFSVGALKLKNLKKRLYLRIAKLLGLYRGVLWQASSEYEVVDIRREFDRDANTYIARDPVTIRTATGKPRKSPCKEPGTLDVVFLSRVSRMKNLAGALKMMHGLKGEISFNIYGPLEDTAYWAECQEIIRSLPENVTVAYCGAVPPEEVGRVMAEHKLFLLPTLGENFGHVIFESLAVGCPVLISDKTPWRGLEEKGVGWDVPLGDVARFRAILQECVDMDSEAYASLSQRARGYAVQYEQDSSVLDTYRVMFDCRGSAPKISHGR